MITPDREPELRELLAKALDLGKGVLHLLGPLDGLHAAMATGASSVGIGTLNQSGGNLLVGSGGMLLGGQASTALGIGTFNLTGGTATLGGDLVSSNGVGTLNLAGGTLDLQGNDIGPAGLLVDNVNLQSGTLRNVGQFQNGAHTREVDIDLEGQITVGKFVDIERPTLQQSMEQQLRYKLHDQYAGMGGV